MPDIFDQLASKQSPGQAPPQPPASPSPQPSGGQGGTGDIFDQLSSGGVPNTDADGTTDTSSNPMHMDQSDSFGTTIGKGVGAVGAGIGDGLLHTVNGLATIAHLPHSTLQARQNELSADGKDNPALSSTGYGAETLMEFLGGDEALKLLPLSKRLLFSSQIAETLEKSPRVMQALQIGANALKSAGRGAVVAGAQGTVRSGGDLNQGAKDAAGGALAGGAMGAAGDAIKAVPGIVQTIRTALDPAGIQAPLHDSLRAVLSDVANDAGINAPTSASIRDVVDDLQQQIKAKAKDTYKTLDNLTGGQAQRFRDSLKNIDDKLGSIVGLDDDKEADLIAQRWKVNQAHQDMIQKLADQGHDKNMLGKADQMWKHQSALGDVSNAVRQSTSGMRPELATGANPTPETVNPKTLSTKLNRLYSTGRLQNAIGTENSKAILNVVDSAYSRAQTIAQNNVWAGRLTKAATAIGLGGIGAEGVHFAHSILGGH